MPDKDPNGKPSIALESQPSPEAPKQRTLTVPKALSEKSRRVKMADVAKKLDDKFDKVDKSVDQGVKERLEKSRVLRSFKPTAANKKDSATDVVTEPEKKAVSTPAETLEKTEAPAEKVKETPERDESGKFAKKLDKKTEETKEPADKATEETKATDKPQAEEKPELPQEYVRSLKAYGYTDDQIAEEMKDPATLMKFARLAHSIRQKEIAAFAEIGRAKAGQQSVQSPAAPAAPAPAVPSVGPLNVEELAKKYNITDPSLLKDLAGPLNAIMLKQQSYEAAQQRAAEEEANKRVDVWFQTPALSAYKEDYAKQEVKDKLLETAAAILNGHTQAGKKLALEDALQMAHDATATPKMKALARAEVMNEAKKRAAGLTQKPSGASSSGTSENKPRTRKELYDSPAILAGFEKLRKSVGR